MIPLLTSSQMRFSYSGAISGERTVEERRPWPSCLSANTVIFKDGKLALEEPSLIAIARIQLSPFQEKCKEINAE